MAFEINGLAAANVAEITNVPKASIVEIYGVETGYVTYPAIARTNTEVMAYRAMAYVVMACIVTATCAILRQTSSWLYSYGL